MPWNFVAQRVGFDVGFCTTSTGQGGAFSCELGDKRSLSKQQHIQEKQDYKAEVKPK